MSMATSLRYEVENPGAKTLKKALLRQAQRIKHDEAMTAQEATIKHETESNLMAQWAEGLDETSYKKKARGKTREIQEELSHANAELTAVRRAQLRSLLTKEQEEYTKELNELGKTFHTQRS